MHRMSEPWDKRLDELLRRPLPPAPASWVTRAEELPRLERALAALDEPAISATQADPLRAALVQAGLEPDEDHVQALLQLRSLRSRS